MLDNLCKNCFHDKGSALICPECGFDGKVDSEKLVLAPGSILNGKYIVGKVLGQGGFGITYLVYDINLGIKVAIKEYLPTSVVTRSKNGRDVIAHFNNKEASFKSGLAKFLEEAKVVAVFSQNRNIVTIREYFPENQTAYMVMDYIQGMDLIDFVKEKNRPLYFLEAIELLNPILTALMQVHKAGLLHRDISPDNIYITDKGIAILLDFGAARQFSMQTQSMSVILKYAYSPIEQHQRKGRRGPWTDIYAFAATFYHVITGKKPAESLDRLESDGLIAPSAMGIVIPKASEVALIKALSIRAGDRYQTMDAFYRAINAPVSKMKKDILLRDKREKEAEQIKAEKREISEERRVRKLKQKEEKLKEQLSVLQGKVVQITTVEEVSKDKNKTPKRSEEKKVKPKIISHRPQKPNRWMAIFAITLLLVGMLSFIGFLLFNKNGVIDASKNNVPVNEKSIYNSERAKTISSYLGGVAAIKIDGSVIYKDDSDESIESDSEITSDIVSVANTQFGVVALIAEGQVIHAVNSVGKDTQLDYDGVSDLVTIGAGINGALVGVKNDGSAIYRGKNENTEGDIENWAGLVDIDTGYNHTVGLKKDGTVVATGSNALGQCDVGAWTNIIDVDAGWECTVALKENGYVYYAGKLADEHFSGVKGYGSNASRVFAGEMGYVVLMDDGTIKAEGIYDNINEKSFPNWANIVDIEMFRLGVVGLKSDGTVISVFNSDYGIKGKEFKEFQYFFDDFILQPNDLSAFTDILVYPLKRYSDENDAEEKDPVGETAIVKNEMKDVYIPIISKGFQHQFWQAVKMGAERAAQEYGVTITFEGPESENNVSEQIKMIDVALQNNPAALCFAALDADAVLKQLQFCKDNDIPVIAFDSGVDSDIPITTASTDNYAAASLAAEKMAELIGESGKVAVIVHDERSRTGIQRRDGFLDKMAADYPDIEIVDVQYSGFNYDKATDIGKVFLTVNPDLAGIFGTNQVAAVGALNAKMAKGKNDVVIIGFDAGATQKDAVRSGTMAGAITQDPVGMGYYAVEAAVKAINGEKLPKIIDTGFHWWDADNMDDGNIAPLLYD
jgi:ribose transport system substrate-binding protein